MPSGAWLLFWKKHHDGGALAPQMPGATNPQAPLVAVHDLTGDEEPQTGPTHPLGGVKRFANLG